MEIALLFVQILAYVLLIAIVIRVVLSLIGFDPANPVSEVLHEITEPVLAPIRQLLPRMGLDISPMIATMILLVIARVASGAMG
jgi:YggT family protein